MKKLAMSHPVDGLVRNIERELRDWVLHSVAGIVPTGTRDEAKVLARMFKTGETGKQAWKVLFGE